MKQDRGDLPPMIAQPHPGDDALAAADDSADLQSASGAPPHQLGDGTPEGSGNEDGGLGHDGPDLATIPTAQLLSMGHSVAQASQTRG